MCLALRKNITSLNPHSDLVGRFAAPVTTCRLTDIGSIADIC